MPVTKLQWAAQTAKASFELDYDLCFSAHVDRILLPPFFARRDDDLAWQIIAEYAPRRVPEMVIGDFDGQWIDFRLYFKSSSGKNEVPVKWTVKITQLVTEDDVTAVCNKFPNVLTKESLGITEDVIYDKIGIEGKLLGSVYVLNFNNNKVVIKVKLTFSKETLSVQNPPPQPHGKALKKSQENSLKALSSCLDGVLQSGLMSDLTLSVDGQELRAHRVILGARSDVFKAMFSIDCRESASGTVKIDDIRPPVFKQFLRFIYSGSLAAAARTSTGAAEAATRRAAGEDGAKAGARDRLQAADEDDCLMELLVAADKYLVEDLKEVCQGRLLHRLSGDVDGASVLTLCDVLRAGHHLASAPLRQVGIGYLRTHRAAVLASPEWKDFATTSRTVAAEAMLDSLMPREGDDS